MRSIYSKEHGFLPCKFIYKNTKFIIYCKLPQTIRLVLMTFWFIRLKTSNPPWNIFQQRIALLWSCLLTSLMNANSVTKFHHRSSCVDYSSTEQIISRHSILFQPWLPSVETICGPYRPRNTSFNCVKVDTFLCLRDIQMHQAENIEAAVKIKRQLALSGSCLVTNIMTDNSRARLHHRSPCADSLLTKQMVWRH